MHQKILPVPLTLNTPGSKPPGKPWPGFPGAGHKAIKSRFSSKKPGGAAA